MKQIITVDARGCGQGKTTDGIYKRINSNFNKNIKTLVVVPSINLQLQYKKDLKELSIPVHVINSQIYNTTNTTVKATLNHMEKEVDVIVITHKTFIMLPLHKNRKMYDLIIDEAIEEVIKKTSVISVDNNDWMPDYDLHNLFSFENETVQEIVDISIDDDENWYRLYQDRTPSHSLISDSPSFRTITDKNYLHFVTPKGWAILNNQEGGVVNVMSTLNPNILSNYKSVHIAAAAFKYTLMNHWLQANNIVTHTQNKFEPHKANIKLWASDNNKFTWSKTKLNKIPEILDDYHSFVNENASGKVVSIRNNQELRSLHNEIRIGHSVHGLNNKHLQNCSDISLESALVIDNHTKQFIIDNWLSGALTKEEMEKAIVHMRSAYLFYQVAMRTKLRNKDYNNERINIFVLDQKTAVCLMDYFDEISDVGHMDITKHYTPKKLGRPQVSEEQKKEKHKERVRRYRLRQKAKKLEKQVK